MELTTDFDLKNKKIIKHVYFALVNNKINQQRKQNSNLKLK